MSDTSGPSPLVQIPNGDAGVTYRDVTGFPGYAVGDDGSVWTKRSVGRYRNVFREHWRKMAPSLTGRGSGQRLSVSLSIGHCHRARRKVHHLVLLAFVGPRMAGQECRHLDGNEFNNQLDNLCWGTKEENEADKILHGTHNRGSRHPLSKINEETAAEIKRLLRSGVKPKQIASQLSVPVQTVYNINAGSVWRHVA